MRPPPAWLPLMGPAFAGIAAGNVGLRTDIGFAPMVALAVGAGLLPLAAHRLWSAAARTTAHRKGH